MHDDNYIDETAEGPEDVQGPGEAPRSDRRPSADRANDGRYSSARELILEGVVGRAREANPRLRAQIPGNVALDLNGAGKYLLDWSNDGPSVKEYSGVGADCTISLTEANLLKIASGELNPQVGMLSGKIKVQGKLEFAIYFFNLVAPLDRGYY